MPVQQFLHATDPVRCRSSTLFWPWTYGVSYASYVQSATFPDAVFSCGTVLFPYAGRSRGTVLFPYAASLRGTVYLVLIGRGLSDDADGGVLRRCGWRIRRCRRTLNSRGAGVGFRSQRAGGCPITGVNYFPM